MCLFLLKTEKVIARCLFSREFFFAAQTIQKHLDTGSSRSSRNGPSFASKSFRRLEEKVRNRWRRNAQDDVHQSNW